MNFKKPAKAGFFILGQGFQYFGITNPELLEIEFH